MNLIVGGKKKAYADGLTVATLMELEQVKTPEYVTVAVNDALIAAGAFDEAVLHDGDSVEFLHFIGGGEGHGV
jgi:sulfur carrier protein